MVRIADRPIKILHDERKVEVKSLEIPEDHIMRTFAQYPQLIFGLLGTTNLCFLLMIIAIPLGIYMESSHAAHARFTSKKEALKMKNFVDYLQANDPDKLKP